jgi:hypothetical protein
VPARGKHRVYVPIRGNGCLDGPHWDIYIPGHEFH